jgi:hypothetical protein
MWGMLALPGQVQPWLIPKMIGAVLGKELRKQARTSSKETHGGFPTTR